VTVVPPAKSQVNVANSPGPKPVDPIKLMVTALRPHDPPVDYIPNNGWGIICEVKLEKVAADEYRTTPVAVCFVALTVLSDTPTGSRRDTVIPLVRGYPDNSSSLLLPGSIVRYGVNKTLVPFENMVAIYFTTSIVEVKLTD
jgi:hypothetical protein